MSFDDPFFLPPADIAGADARAYEEKIVELLREALIPSGGPLRFVDSVELRGERPDTEVIIRYTDTREQGPQAVRSRPWKEFIAEHRGAIDSAASIGSAIFSRWSDGTLEPVEDE